MIKQKPKSCKKSKFSIFIGCSNFAEISGMPLYNYRLGKEFVKRGFDVTIVAPRVKGEIVKMCHRVGIDCIQDNQDYIKDYDVLLVMETISEKYLDEMPDIPAWYYCHSMLYECDQPIAKRHQIRGYFACRQDVANHWEKKIGIKSEVIPIPVDEEFFLHPSCRHKKYTILAPCAFNDIREPMIRNLVERARDNPKIEVVLVGQDHGVIRKLDLPKNVTIKPPTINIVAEMAMCDEVAGLFKGTVTVEAWAMDKKTSVYDEQGNYKIVKKPKDFDKHKIEKVADKFIERFNEKWADIIIPHHDQVDLLAQCLKSIPLRNYNVILTRGGTFGYNCNKGAKLAETDTLIFANDDIIVNPQILWELADNKNDVVGVQQYYPDGNKFCLGVYVDKDYTYRMTNDYDEVMYPSGAFFMIKRQLWEKMGGFNLGFINGGEDQDLFLRIIEASGKIDFADDSIIHYESQSTGRFDNCSQSDNLFYKLWTPDRLKKLFT